MSGSVGNTEGQIAYGAITNEERTVEGLELSSPEVTEKIVREYFSDIPIMAEVARCESTFRHRLSDGSVLTGKVDPADTGVMQINKRYHLKTANDLGLDLEKIEDNLEYARYLYEKKGTQPWSASAPCWKNTLASNV